MKTTAEKPVGPMHNPPHPGEVLHDLWMEPLGLTITKTAGILNVSRKTVSQIVNGKSSITPDMAMRIAIAFNSRAGLWLDMQAGYDAWQAEKVRKDLEREVTVIHWEEAA